MEDRMARGEFVWRDLMTGDVERACAFYGALLGWTFREGHSMGGPYTFVHDGHGESAGILELPDGDGAPPPAWLPYVQVEDCMAAVDEVESLGGSVIMGATPVEGVGYFAVVVDPNGAVFHVMQLDDPDSAPAGPPRAGQFCWYTLYARDLEKAKRFYGALCGWKTTEVDLGGGRRQANFVRDGAQVAGLLKGERSAWSVAVVAPGSLAEAHAKAISLGATELMPPTPVGDMGTASGIVDPTGAPIALFQLA
jgi:hypothetical protein